MQRDRMQYRVRLWMIKNKAGYPTSWNASITASIVRRQYYPHTAKILVWIKSPPLNYPVAWQQERRGWVLPVAVMGAYLVIGLKHGNSSPSDKSATEKTFELIQEFDRQFCQKHGSTNCRRLLGVDLRNGDKNFAIRQVKLLCPGFVQDAAEILESII